MQDFTLPAPTRREVLDGLTSELEGAGIDSPRAEAERLLCHALDTDRSALLLHLDTRLEPEQARRLAAAIARRLAGVPLQHIEGTVAFRDLTLVCDERALIPRPETEQLVERIAAWASGDEGRGSGVVRVRRPRTGEPRCEAALDIGTGSGAIALSLVQEGIARRAVGVDVSPAAIEQASENRKLAGLEEQVELRTVVHSPWEAVGADDRFDLIVSNPPYVRDSEIADLAREVKDHEPRLALAGGADGLDLVRRIARQARGHLRAGGALFLEIGAGQGATAVSIVAEYGPWESVEACADLAGHDRFVIAVA